MHQLYREDANTGKRCGAKAVDNQVLKAAFAKVYNEEFKDKGSFFKAFLANVEKVIQDNSGSEFAERITAMETDLRGLISMKLHKEINGDNNRHYTQLY